MAWREPAVRFDEILQAVRRTRTMRLSLPSGAARRRTLEVRATRAGLRVDSPNVLILPRRITRD